MDEPYSTWDDKENILGWDERPFTYEVQAFYGKVNKVILLPLTNATDVNTYHEQAKALKDELDLFAESTSIRDIPPYRKPDIDTVIRGMYKDVFELLLKSHQAASNLTLKREDDEPN